ncbi:hypothetical protein OG259_01385 [Streptomyces sp. NBC_00250]|uniref:hypothetical protein n=1 Tax=Streptomyces sp. NBC_00250 TaxID=2903641 RepID=UPI002E2D5A8D|nr:hypothetical protein [Streptomyces sp. NBC_00250]
MSRPHPEGPLVHPDDPAFRAWLRELSRALDRDFEEDLGSPGGLGFLRSAFTHNGAVPAPYFAPVVDEHRRIHAERIVTVLLAQAHRDTGRAFEVPVRHEWSDERAAIGQVTVGHETVWGLDPVDIAVEAAEGVQCHLADRERVVWPLCPAHRTGPHATRTPTGAAWVCSVTAHVVAPIQA